MILEYIYLYKLNYGWKKVVKYLKNEECLLNFGYLKICVIKIFKF